MITCVYLILLLLQNITCKCNQNIEVDTNLGKIKGLKACDGDYYMYLGIPYGKLGENPFGLSMPYPPFNGTFQAYDDSIICPQVNRENNNKIMGTLDCLRLNIYVPASTTDAKKLPVMVWLHGGQFKDGFGGRYLFGPTYLVRHNVIIVTLNYRLGPYGFMCLDIPEVTGNQGLKDQYLALEWIKNNIQAFGGDAEQITLFGQSAGGHSIDLHLMSTKEVLFNKAILESGSAQAFTVLNEPDKSAPLELASYIGFSTNDTREALKHLSETDPKLIIEAATNLKIQFKPCVEKQYDNVEPFIVRPWINTKAPKVKDIPILMGFNKLEYASIFFSKEKYFLSNLTIVSDLIEHEFYLNNQDIFESIDFVYHFYFGDEKIGKNVKWPLVRFLSDYIYIHPIHITLKKFLENGAGNIYFYMFSYVGGSNAIITKTYDECDSNDHLCCASHKDELGYLFKAQNKPNLTAADRVIMKRMTTMWTNFAKTSNPTPKKTELLPVKWEPVTNDTYYYLDIDTVLKLGKRPLHERMALWDMFYKCNRPSQKLFDRTN